MSLRRLAVSTSLVFLLLLAATGCLTTPSGADAGDWSFDAGNPPPRDACSGGCAENQRCDTATHECVDGCGGCVGSVCVKASDGTFSCQSPITHCGAATCAAGQIACVAGACTCVSALNGTADSCGPQGGWCDDGTTCSTPKRYEQCLGSTSTAKCPSGHLCDPVFGSGESLCVRDCSSTDTVCDRGEKCARISSGYGCLPLGLFANQECSQHAPLDDGGFTPPDGGLRRFVVPVANTCLVKNANAAIIDPPGRGTGNCTYALFKYWGRGVTPYRTCRPSGAAQEGDVCRTDSSSSTVATQCGLGLECMPARTGDQGICFRMCNANRPEGGVTPEPACGTGEACVNLYRYTDPNNNAVVGVCLKTCNVFDGARNSCLPVGAQIATSCVPTASAGDAVLSLSGEGICVPRHPEAVGLNQACRPVDPFRGSACGDGQLCHQPDETLVASCLGVCDLDCNPGDGGAGPARCATEPSARCESGASCHASSGSPAARVGFCW